jgi:crossover junction endodeoxyribonuclease RuvC
MKVFGIDPGSRRTGWAVIRLEGRAASPVAYGTIAAPEGAMADRIATIGRALERLLNAHTPDVVGLEQAFYAKSVRATIVLGQVRGLALWLAASRGLRIVELAPRAVKLAVTGRGGASKPQVAAMVSTLLALTRRPSADAADALAIALSCARRFDLVAVVAPSRAAAAAGPVPANGLNAVGVERARPRAMALDGTPVDLSRAFVRARRAR